MRATAASDFAVVVNAAFPLESSVVTSLSPACSSDRFRSVMRRFIGLTPRRKAT